HPLGLNGRNIIMVNDVGRWFPWLLPCPPAKYSSPCDLFGADSPVISAIAPEVIRDVYFDDRAQDNYALGTLAIHGLGCKESRQAITDEDRIEAQARGALLNCELKFSEVEAFLHGIEPLKHLIQVVQHYTQISPVARPIESTALKTACTNAFTTTDPVVLALDLVKHSNSHEALKILQWGLKAFGENLKGRLLAASICEKIEELPQALEHLDRAVSLAPRDPDLRWQRCNLRWLLYQKLPPLNAGEPDPQGELLIKDLTLLKSMTERNPTEKNLPYIMAAQVHHRRHDLESAAKELHRAAELEPADMNALYLYGKCLKDLGDHNAVSRIVQIAHNRIDKMIKAEMMEKMEAQKWREKFNALLNS
ncbi:MAG: tetratricopeptide repeat protein, partial [bacterium]